MKLTENLSAKAVTNLLRKMKLRPYQGDAVDCVFKEWEDHDSTLVVMPTGCGKTLVFCEIIKKIIPTRGLILVHRAELAYQAVNRLSNFGIEAEIEMADLKASNSFWNRAPVVVSTVQTQTAGNNGSGRMSFFKPEDFGVVICDEAHHFTSPQFKKVLDYYRTNPKLKIMGCTATPDRADEEALGKVFQSVAYDYEILEAIEDGWLVPITQQMVQIEGLDFSHIKTTAGDLNSGELATVMEAENMLQGIASATLQIVGENKRTLVFTASVKQAEMMANIFNRHRDGMAGWVCGKTPKEERRKALKEFSDGKTQIMVNCNVLGEGFDEPAIEVIIQARPTKSRCLYSQQIGRSTRPLPGIVDKWGTPDERKAAIAASAKPNCLVVDFVGNSGRHKLMTTADILGGKFSEEEIELAERKAKQSGRPVDMTEELEAAREALEERKRMEIAKRARLVGKATFSVKTINPFDVFDIQPERARGWDEGKQISEKQRALLLKQGIDPSGMSYHQTRQLLNEMFRRWGSKLATLKQCKLLKRYGMDTKNMPMKEASKIIDAIANNHWNLPDEFKPKINQQNI